MSTPLALGRLCATPGALELLGRVGIDPLTLLARHQRGDWGDIPAEDAAENQLSLREGYRVMSSYAIGDDRVWVITEADRSITTLLLPDEY
jgi:hypothetical protein